MAFFERFPSAIEKQLGKTSKSTITDQIVSIPISMAVAETGALNGATRQMEISPSAVSKNITALKK